MNIFRHIYDTFVTLLSSVFRIKRISNEEARGILEEERSLRILEALDKVSEPIDPHPKGTSTFDPNSERAIAGLDFQNSVFEQLKEEFPDNNTFEETWNYFKKQNPDLTVYELACLEKEWGDITFVHEGQRFWVECCYAMGEKNSWFCEMKRLKFRGTNKFYCWGKRIEPGKTWFIQAATWNNYVTKCEKIRQGKKSFRVVPVHLIGDNIRKAKRGVDEFAKYIA